MDTGPSFMTWLPLMTAKRLPSSSDAAGRVFQVGELVEQIIIHLPPADILRCRRLTKLFDRTVTFSKAIRQALFLERDDTAERIVNPLAPTWFIQQKRGYRDNTIAARIDVAPLWDHSQKEIQPLWDRMLIAQPPTKTCVIPVGDHLTIFFRRFYADGMTFGDLKRAVIAAFEIRKGRRSSRERLEELTLGNSVLIYWS